jgi:hypothetical protein
MKTDAKPHATRKPKSERRPLKVRTGVKAGAMDDWESPVA